jgi:hypothetical protein
MEQMIEHLRTEMEANQKEMKAKIRTNLEDMKALLDINLEEVSACLGVMEASLGKMEPMMKAGQEQMRAEVKTRMEEIKAIESKGNQEKIEALAEHCEEVLWIKAMHLLAVLQDQASDVLHKDPKGTMYKETIRAIED